MARSIVMLTTALLIFTPVANLAYAEPISPLDRSIEDIKRDITSVVHCKWSEVTPTIQHCEDRDEKRGEWIGIQTTADGKINYLHFSPFIYKPDKYPVNGEGNFETTRARETQAATISAIQKLWPSWKAGPAWMKAAFKNARKKDFQDCMRFEDTSVYLSEVGPVDSDDRFAFIGLTKKTNLTELKDHGHGGDEEDPDFNKCNDVLGN